MEKKQLFKYTACKKVNNHNNFWKKIIVFNLDVAIIIKLLFIYFFPIRRINSMIWNTISWQQNRFAIIKISKSKISSDVTCILCQITTSNLKQSNISIVENVYYFDSDKDSLVLNMVFKTGYCWYVHLFKIIRYSHSCIIKNNPEGSRRKMFIEFTMQCPGSGSQVWQYLIKSLVCRTS